MKKSDLTLITAVVFWGMSFIWTKSALSTLSVYSIIFIRFSAATVILFIIAAAVKKNLKIKSGMLSMILLTFFQPFSYFLFETNSLRFISTQKASLIAATIPLVVMIITSVFRKKFPGILNILSILISISGIILLLGMKFSFTGGSSETAGTALMFGAVFSAAVYIILTNRLAKEFDSFVITFYQMLFGSIMLLPLFIADSFINGLIDITPSSAAGLFSLTVFSTVSGFLCYNYAISKVSTSKSALYLNAVPIVTIIAAFIIRKEILSLTEFAGATLILFSLYLISVKKGNENETDNTY